MGGRNSKLHKDVLEKMPPEIIFQIFEMLTPLEIATSRLVCTHWNDFIPGTPSLLRKLQ